MTLEQYILMRKKEDSLNEYDLSKRSENIRICVNYIFEYFDNYLENSPDSEKTFLEEQKQDKYRQLVSKYSPDVQDWLVELNSRSSKHVHRHLQNLIEETYFLLFNTDSEFRSLSYSIYPIIKALCCLGSNSARFFYVLSSSYMSIERQKMYLQNNYNMVILP